MSVSAIQAALAVEAHKALASPVMRAASILIVGGIALIAGALTYAAETGNEQVIGKLGMLADEGGWELLTGAVAQVTAAGALLGFGVVLSWMIGREYSDGVIGALFALPVGRPTIAFAKLAVYVLWTIATAVALTLLVGAVGFALDLGRLDSEVLGALGRQFALTVFTALLAIPAAWAATLGRGLLTGITTTVGIVVIAQVMVVAGTGAWFPFAAPALWAFEPSDVSAAQLVLVTSVPLLFGALTLRAWACLQLDR